jgi:iron complex outermembrane receptor protein
MNLYFRKTAVLLILLSSSRSMAQIVSADTGNADSVKTLGSVIITGTRQSGLKAADSAAPVQVLDAATLQRTGQADLIKALTQNLPSFTSDAKGGDASALTTAARLRGLSPNHTLVLVNGKRRHGTSNLNVSASAFQGGAAADLGLIPLSAIDHIEVLQDGAAAQYGSDAIAGVINIILKSNSSGGVINAGWGRYYDGGGITPSLSANIGFAPTDSSYLNFSAETKHHDHSDQSDYDARFVAPYLKPADANVKNVSDYPYVNHAFGDAEVQQSIFSVNAGVEIDPAIEVYGFATYGRKDAEAIQNYRGPSTAVGVYPLGFSPIETHDETDYSFTAGAKGKAVYDWNYDLSFTTGEDTADVGNIDSLNVQLWKDTGASPTDFYEGYLESTQKTANLDFNRDFDVGWVEPLNAAFGFEWRKDGYAIGEGEPASVYRGGAAAFPGFTASDAGNHSRTSSAVYFDLAFAPIEKLKLDTALRTEHFSDFGNATIGKLTGRYDFTSIFAVRGTLSNGFRAPTLAEDYYSATSVSPTTASVILPSAASAARLLGLDELEAEKSRNISLGIVLNPSAKLTATLDVYRITIDNRILQSGTIYGKLNGVVISPAVNAAIAANGNVIPAGINTSGVSIYSNAADTRNTGADLLLTYADNYGAIGNIDWTAALNYNEVEVTKVDDAPPQIGTQKILDQAALSYIEDSSPQFRLNLGATWKKDDWIVSLHENIFGSSSYLASIDNTNYYRSTLSTKFITDLEVINRITKAFSLSIGANNLFNVYPDKLNADYRNVLNVAGRQNVAVYPSFSPIGINGGYYYARATFKF